MMSSAEALDELADRYWAFERREQPFSAFLAGQAGDEVVLFRNAPYDFDRRLAESREMLSAVRAISLEDLGPQDVATHRLLERELTEIEVQHGVDAHLRPSLLPVGPEFNTVFYANSAAVADGRSARLHVERLAAFPAFLDDVRACLHLGYERGFRYPRVVLEAAVANIQGLCDLAPEASPWFGPFRRSAAAAQPDVAQEAARALDVIGTAVIPALKAYGAYIAGPLSVGARTTLSCSDAPRGRAFYAAQVEHFTTLALSPSAVHDLGLSEVARVQTKLEALAEEAGYGGDLVGYRRFLTEDPQFIAPDAETLRQQLEVLCKRIDGRIPAFFGRIPRITYGVESIPAAQSAAMPPAYAQPASPGGSVAGIFWINGLPEKCPSYLHPAIAVHEAWPGHLMHIALMSELEDLPAFRRYGAVKYTACVEGWALYCEQLGLDLGIYKTAHHHYGRLEMEMWRACRLVVDTGIHHFDWSRERSIAYMRERLTLSRDTIAAEVDRYAALPGQALAYQIGGLKFRELRARAEDALGPAFSLRDFHDALMSPGALTLPVLEELTQVWIAERLSADA